MAIIKLRIPEDEESINVTLAPESAVLIGRDPSTVRLDAALQAELSGTPLKLLKVPSMRLSANHLLLRASAGGVKVYDLHSRNGTWLRLPPLLPAALSGQAELTFDLAAERSGTPSLSAPRDAEWTSESEYSATVVGAISSWLQASGLGAEVFARPSGSVPERDAGAEAISLADGSQLHVLPPRDGTVDVPWGSITDRVRDYVNQQNVRFDQLQGHDDDFILVSPIMRAVHREIVDAAAYGMRLMLLGPTGAGKERLARCFHRHSRQHRGPYTTVNCALLKENLLYAQLFGAKKGSYTGAVQDVVGVIEAANEGTLFLDEVGEMDLEVQKALLRFLDSRGEYQRLGDTHTRRAHVQIVCATNVMLDSPGERRGKFRDDLWYRLAVKVVQVPPLSQRRGDIIAFLKARTLRAGQIRALDALTPGALQLALDDPWPGNFRDLENFVERLPATAQPGSLDETVCRAALNEGRRAPDPKGQSSGGYRPVFSGLPPAGAPGDWPSVAEVANAAFTEDYGCPPGNWGQLQLYMEKYFKPVFIAQACRLTELNEISKGINYSELARRLNIADGSTIKTHLSRYIERFRKGARTVES